MTEEIEKSLLVFGPQKAVPSQSVLARIRNLLRTEPSLASLRTTIQQLPSLCSSSSGNEFLSSECAGVAAKQLADWIVEGTASQWSDNSPNALLSTLSVLVDLVTYHSWSRSASQNGLHTHTSTQDHRVGPQYGVLGLCIGALSAQAVAASGQQQGEFASLASTAVRLALLVGAVVDAQNALPNYAAPAAVVTVRFTTDRLGLLNQTIAQTQGVSTR